MVLLYICFQSWKGQSMLGGMGKRIFRDWLSDLLGSFAGGGCSVLSLRHGGRGLLVLTVGGLPSAVGKGRKDKK